MRASGKTRIVITAAVAFVFACFESPSTAFTVRSTCTSVADPFSGRGAPAAGSATSSTTNRTARAVTTFNSRALILASSGDEMPANAAAFGVHAWEPPTHARFGSIVCRWRRVRRME